MNSVNQPTKCANCAYLLDHPTLMVDGESFCCSGCARGGPCLCAYDQAPDVLGVASGTHVPLDSSPVPYDPDCPYSEAFARIVENVLKDVEITQQALQNQVGPVKDLLDLLQRTARLLQIMTYRLEEQKHAETPDWVSRIQEEVQSRQPEETIKLFVEGVSGPDAVFCYTRALAKLPSVQEMKLVNLNGADVCYQVQTSSKAKFAREVVSLPDYPPLRIHSTPTEITVVLNIEPASDADALADPINFVHTSQQVKTEESRTPPQAQPVTSTDRTGPNSGGKLEVGIDGFFNARHYLIKDGEPGPVEMKSWRVEISLQGEQSAETGQQDRMDSAEKAIQMLLAGYNNKLLNKLPPYDEIQPSPENIARILYQQINTAIDEYSLTVKGLKVWVSPTQYVWYSEPPDHAT